MKKILLLILSLALFSSCGSYTENEYRCEIFYTIGGTDYSDTVTIRCTSFCAPMYVVRDGSIIVDSYPHGDLFERKVIYQGNQDVKVNDFKSTVVRTYKASRWDGKEIKKKKLSRLH